MIWPILVAALATLAPNWDDKEKAADLRCTHQGPAAIPVRMESGKGNAPHTWLAAPATLTLRNEATGAAGTPEQLGLAVKGVWREAAGGLAWDLMFEGQGPRSGHEVKIELPVLGSNLEVFVPGDDGNVKLSERTD